MAENFTLYKLIILYMLNLAKGPMTASHISEFILGQDYTDYFTLQQSLSELTESNLLVTTQTNNATLLEITARGRDTLPYFGDRISEGIRKDIFTYLNEKEIDIREDVSATAEVGRTLEGGYVAHCMLRDSCTTLIDLTLSCKTKAQAEAMCTNWQMQNFEVYSLLMDLLLK